MQRAPDSILEAVAPGLALDEVRHNFRVGFRDELVALALQLLLQIQIILDDPVVHDDDLPGAVAVWMRILFGGSAVSGPAGMPHAVFTRNRLAADDVFQA